MNERGVEFCFQCADFPCLKLAPCADRANVIPHNQKVYNLVLMQKLGVKDWAEQARDIWSRYFRGKKPFGGSEIKM